MDTSPNTHPNVVDETTNLHVNIDDKEKELLIIASTETLKHQNKKCGKDEVLALVKDSFEEAITMASFEKSLEFLQASHSINCYITSNRTYLSIPKHNSIPKVSTQNTSSIKNDFEDCKSIFIKTLNLQTELFMKQQKELFFNEINLFKNELLTSLKHNTISHAHESSNKTDRIISLLQDQIEFVQEQLKSKDKIMNSLIENLSRNNNVFFSQKAATLKIPENQTNYKQIQNTKTIESKESQNKNTPGCLCNK